MPTVITQGAASAKGYGFGARATAANYIEDVFSTYLYTGTGASQTITNGIDLAGKGGLVWIKGRSGATDHALYDTANITGGLAFGFASNTTEAATYRLGGLDEFLANGFSIGNLARINTNAATYASWSFRKQAKFFDIVTYTGTGANRTIAHNLGSVPGCIMIKRADTTAAWAVYHRSLANTQYMVLNTTAAAATGATYWNSTTPTSSVFSLGTSTDVNASGGTYFAYIFAHDAGGFGATGTDNVISCGSYTGNGNPDGLAVTLGYEPQFILIKRTNAVGDWLLHDNMRSLAIGNSETLFPNNSNAAAVSSSSSVYSTATGFYINDDAASYNASGGVYVYIAIRRGPMKTPTTGTSVFGLSARAGTGANATVTDGQMGDAVLIKNRGSAVQYLLATRLTSTLYLDTASTSNASSAGTNVLQAKPWDVMNGVKVGTTSAITNASGSTFINYLFKRAPGFFDVVYYAGTDSNMSVTHNLGVVPELMIVKSRTLANAWQVYSSALGNTKYLVLNTTAASATGSTRWNNTTPTASVFSVGSAAEVNSSTSTYYAYLFATVAGVSKVGSYTGTGTTNQINCGFTGGARFVLIKRTDSTGDWYVWDSARGIVAGNDPYLLLNSTAAEVTGTDYVDTYSAGFEISSTAPAAINANGGTFIFLAIA